MADISMDKIKELRERTQAGFMDCKKALQENDGDIEKAITYLREKGLAAAAKKAGRVASEGVIDSYIHMGGRIGVLIEVNCETDFVAKTDAFRALVKDLAMQIAASKPQYVSREEVPAKVVEEERSIYAAAARNEGKPEQVIDKIVDGRMEKFYKDVCLMEQPFVKDPDRSIKDIITEAIATMGENINVRRFVRFERGEGTAVDAE
ncbi:MAG TPA: translation elongation factor Ts [Firmicutes bacterium]|jgi:elongation factor Ts|nr:translation elongation factor Ts [Bacillota bacterium]